MTQRFEYLRDGYTKDGVAFRLRPAALADSESITANIRSVCAEQVYLHSDTFVLTDPWRHSMACAIDEPAGCLLIVAEVDDVVVGHLRLFAEWYGKRGRHVGEIGLSLVKPWRERGIGAAMVNYAVAWANYAQFQKLTAAVIATNRRALNLFAKFDFVSEGYRTRQFNIAGQYVDEVWLGRFLNGDISDLFSS